MKTALEVAPGAIIFADVTPTLLVLGAAIEECTVLAGRETSKSVTVDRKAAKKALADNLTDMGMSCMLIAKGDPDKLEHCGFPLRKVTEHSHATPPAPANLRLKNGPGGGTVTAKVKPTLHADV